MPAKLIVIGLDGVEAPVFAELNSLLSPLAPERSVTARLVGSHEFLPDTVWPEIHSGRSAATTGIYSPPAQVRTGERRLRSVRREEMRPPRSYWNTAAAAGLSAAAIDQPFSYFDPEHSAIEVGEWGTHDRPGWATGSHDTTVASIVDRHGLHPVTTCDSGAPRSPNETSRLMRALRSAVEQKTALAAEILALRDWDLFSLVLSEGHCAGHQCWPLPDAGPATELEAVYSDLGGAAEHLVALADDATVVLYSSHGMAPADHGRRLVGLVLERMGLGSATTALRRRLSRALPRPVREAARKSLLERSRRLDAIGRGPMSGRSATAVALPNSRYGAVRLLLEGRDPGGSVGPGSAGHRELIERLTGAFSGLVEVGTGGPAVEDVVEVDDLLGSDRSPDLPDLIIRFRSGGAIGECSSPELGRLAAPIRSSRTGEHGTPGAVRFSGPGINTNVRLGDIRTIDLAPTITRLLGLPVPSWADGDPVAVTMQG